MSKLPRTFIKTFLGGNFHLPSEPFTAVGLLLEERTLTSNSLGALDEQVGKA